MTLLTISVLVGLAVSGFFIYLISKSKVYKFIPWSLLLGVIFGMMAYTIGYQVNGMNDTPLSHWNNFTTIELVEVEQDGLFGDTYKLYVTYDSDTYEVTINYDCPGPYKREDISIMIKDYYGDIVYLLWSSRADHDDWIKIKSIFIDKFSKEEIKSVEETEKPIKK